MIKLPSYFIRQFDSKALATIQAWWTQLTPAQQQEMAQMYADIDPSKFSEDQLEFISLEMYEPYQQEIRSKRKEWMRNEYWLSGFTEYVINQDTCFTGFIPLVCCTYSRYVYLCNSENTTKSFQKSYHYYHNYHYLTQIYHWAYQDFE